MAEILDKLPESKRGRNPLYDQFLDGVPRRLKKGVDFTCKTQSVVTTFYERAKKLGVGVTVIVEDENTVSVQASNVETENV